DRRHGRVDDDARLVRDALRQILLGEADELLLRLVRGLVARQRVLDRGARGEVDRRDEVVGVHQSNARADALGEAAGEAQRVPGGLAEVCRNEDQFRPDRIHETPPEWRLNVVAARRARTDPGYNSG